MIKRCAKEIITVEINSISVMGTTSLVATTIC